MPAESAIFPGIVLAAGGSTRLGGGRAKQLLVYEGETLLRRAVEAAVAAAGAEAPVIVVLGHRAEECRAAVAGLPARAVWAADWAAGMGASLKSGLRAALSAVPDAAGVVVSLCDQPLVGAGCLSALRRAPEKGCTVVAAEYGGVPGVPARFGRELFGEILAMTDTAGAKGLLLREEAAGRLVRVPMPEAAVDVDTPEDAAAIRASVR